MPNPNEPRQSSTPEGFGVPWEQPKSKPEVPQDDNDTVLMDNPFTGKEPSGDDTVLAPPGQGSFRPETTPGADGDESVAASNAYPADATQPASQSYPAQDQAYPGQNPAYPSDGATGPYGGGEQSLPSGETHGGRPGDQAYPPAQGAYPEQGRAAYPEQGQAAYPEQGRAAYPEQGQATYPGQSQGYPTSQGSAFPASQGSAYPQQGQAHFSTAAGADEAFGDGNDTVLSPPPGRQAPPADHSATVLAPPGAGNFTQSVAPQPQQAHPPVATGPVGDRFEPATAATPKRKFPLWAAILAGLLALALIAGLLFFFLRPKPAPAPTPTPSPTPTVSLPPAPPAVLSKDAHDIKLPDKVDPWFPRTVPGDPAPQGARRSTFAMADETSPKRLIMDVYEGGSTTLDQRSQALAPDSIKDHDKYRCGRLADTKAPICLASVGNGVMEAHGNISDIQDGTVEDAFNNWVKANS